jgi:iron-sulfur cluster assembly accessory protein
MNKIEIDSKSKPDNSSEQKVNPIRVTPAAIQYLRRKLHEKEEGTGLRIGLRKAGCSGWFYDFSYSRHKADNDLIFWIEPDIYLVLDKSLLQSFKGSIIDCVKTGLSRSLTCINPNEGARCGCGESFTLNE